MGNKTKYDFSFGKAAEELTSFFFDVEEEVKKAVDNGNSGSVGESLVEPESKEPKRKPVGNTFTPKAKGTPAQKPDPKSAVKPADDEPADDEGNGNEK